MRKNGESFVLKQVIPTDKCPSQCFRERIQFDLRNEQPKIFRIIKRLFRKYVGLYTEEN